MNRPIRPETAALAVAAFVLAALNAPFWRSLYRAVEPSGAYEWCFLGSVFVCALAVTNLALTALAIPRLFKAVVVPLLIVTAMASYFMGEYGIVIDRHMIQNVLETNTAEASDLVSWHMIPTVLGLGILPAWLLWRTPIAFRPLPQELSVKAKVAFASIVVFANAATPFYMNFTSVFREHGELRHTLAPLNFISASLKYLQKSHHEIAAPVVPMGLDAHRTRAEVPVIKGLSSPRKVSIVVIGETARAENFSLGGYVRPTNPLLAKVKGLQYFDKVTSCGTDTAQSVPCMFSGAGRKHFSSDIALKQEGLIDVLQHAGISVLWRENQSGCKGVCNRVPTELLTGQKLKTFFENGESHDEILIDGIEDKIAAMPHDGVIFLHMMGSHGPAYYKRYPKQFEIFKPACQESQFSRCTNEQIVNAYDNTIVYTDFVLAQLIGKLDALSGKGIATSLIYVSDHGESLGENNMYLHGMPFALAPEQQKHVPMLIWLPDNTRSLLGIDGGCLAGHAHALLSHDNLFHSVIGLMGVETALYDKGLDIFAACRAVASSGIRLAPEPKL